MSDPSAVSPLPPKSCPFCDAIPKSNGAEVWCIRQSCGMFKVPIPSEQWNHRSDSRSQGEEASVLPPEIDAPLEGRLLSVDDSDGWIARTVKMVAKQDEVGLARILPDDRYLELAKAAARSSSPAVPTPRFYIPTLCVECGAELAPVNDTGICEDCRDKPDEDAPAVGVETDDTTLLDWLEASKPTAVFWNDRGGSIPNGMTFRRFIDAAKRAKP